MRGACVQATPRLLGYLWIVTVVGIICGLLPWGIWELHREGSAPHVIAWLSAGVFVSLAVPISIFAVAQHLQNFFNPELQRLTMRCIWMVPIYAVDSFISLRFHEVALYFDTVRECYEAYVIYNFYRYLLTYMKQQQPDFEEMIKGRPPARHIFPFCCLRPWVMGPDFLFWVHTGPMSYVICRLFCTFLTLVTAPVGLYGEGSFDFNKSYVYVAIFNSAAQTWALYCLMLLYFAFHGKGHGHGAGRTASGRSRSGSGLRAKLYEGESPEAGAVSAAHGEEEEEDTTALLPPNTHMQAIVVKGIVFVTFWQSVIIAILVHFAPQLFHSTSETWAYYRNDKNVAAAFQDWLICVEMFFFALAFRRAFTHEDYIGGTLQHGDGDSDDGDFVALAPPAKLTFVESLRTLFDTTDVRDDVVGSTTQYVRGGAAAVAGAAKDVHGSVMGASSKVAGAGEAVAAKVRSTFSGTHSTAEKQSLLGSGAAGDKSFDGGTFD